MRQALRSTVLAGLLLGLAGCSSTTFLYNRLDFIIPWYVGKYVELTRDQKKFLDAQLEPFLAWHRSQELPLYLGLIDAIEQSLEGEVGSEQVAAIVGRFEQAWLRIEFRGLEWMLALGEELSREQMEEFVATLRDKQEEYEEEYLSRSDAEYREEAYENLEDSAQDFLGRLDWGQRATLEGAAGRLQRSDAIWLRERARWLDRLEHLLQREAGWQDAVRAALRNREQTTSAEYQAVYEHNAQVIYQALATLANTRSENQDRRLRKRLEDLREDVESLIARGG
ncbi:hypothetical protein DWB85_09285 [Seongchinamella sediminis]|uniref:Lipoprotein n=1 Tax=Seongchinamella sediminis TaxID=2283635 RepID=A0A3L7DX29_9GAMM|nr:DUF6279 family lipoprotein [Seongchinamella sediminis]RLQ22117.1 hypothetical protein DWB85_09285 [Seongchinamella sediminis]